MKPSWSTNRMLSSLFPTTYLAAVMIFDSKVSIISGLTSDNESSSGPAPPYFCFDFCSGLITSILLKVLSVGS